jgi:hypothetical protein
LWWEWSGSFCNCVGKPVSTLRIAAPALLLAWCILLPFLNKPFTIDDPLFLRAAEHAWQDPLHPLDFEQVWNTGERLRLAEFLTGGALPAYVLLPVVWAGSSEWAAHLYQMFLLGGFLIASVSVARRLGCDPRQARAVGLLVASNPVTLAMASTTMPDVMASCFGLVAIDRLLAFSAKGGGSSGLAGAVALAAAMLSRASAAMLALPPAIHLQRKRLRPLLLWPFALAAVLALGFLRLNRGGAGIESAVETYVSSANIPRNLVGFLCFQALTGPVLLYALLLEGWRLRAASAALLVCGIALTALPYANLQVYAVAGAIGLCFLAALAIVARKIPKSKAAVLPLLIPWLCTGLLAAPYVHMAAKYLLPSVPAAALLIVLHGAALPPPRFRAVLIVMVTLGCIAGALIVAGDAALAQSQRNAVDSLIVPRLKEGSVVWAAGQWAFLHYAQRAGARALANTAPLPKPGDFIAVSTLDYFGRLHRLPIKMDLVHAESDRRFGVFVLNRALKAGFYGNRFGYLPFVVGRGEVNRYEVWRVR